MRTKGCEDVMLLGSKLKGLCWCFSLAILFVLNCRVADAQVNLENTIDSKSSLELEKYEQALKERERLLLQAVPAAQVVPLDNSNILSNPEVENAPVNTDTVSIKSEPAVIKSHNGAELIVDGSNDGGRGSLITNELEGRLQASHIRITELLKELDSARRRLVIAETEVERLSSIIEGGSAKSTRDAKVEAQAQARVARPAVPQVPEMPIATVTVNKANLRTGPGLDNSPLMTVSRGTRLAIETRQGDWYRAITPTGARAWVSGDVIAFGAKDQWAPSQTVKVGGYDLQAEEAAFALISEGIE